MNTHNHNANTIEDVNAHEHQLDNSGTTTQQIHKKVLIWDVPVRLIHWLMALSFAGAYLTSESDNLRWLHMSFGYTMFGLMAFRVVWGFIGSRHARFSAFVRSPQQAIAYLRSLFSGKAQHYPGHNPAGAIAIVALLLLGLAQGVSGYLMQQELVGEWMEEVHEGIAVTLLSIVIIHIVAVIVSSVLHRDNLIRAMFSGYKRAASEQAIPKSRLAIGIIITCIVAAFWAWQVQQAQTMPSADQQHQEKKQDDDDD